MQSLLLLLAPLLLSQDHAPADPAPELVLAREYLELLTAGDVDAAGRHLAPNAVYADPTSAALAGSGRLVTGRDAILRHFRRSTASQTSLRVDGAFVSDGEVVLNLTYRSHADAGVIGAGEDVATAVTSEIASMARLTVADGRIQRHVEYVDYDAVLRSLTTDLPIGAGTRTSDVADAYLTHLYAGELAEARGLLHADAVFEDPTSAPVGGPWRFEGADAILGFFARSLESASASSFTVERAFTAGEYRVLTLTYTTQGDGEVFGIAGQVKGSTDAVTVLRVRDGRVVEHLDLVDYPRLLAEIGR